QNGCRIAIGRRLRDGAFNNVARHSRDLTRARLDALGVRPSAIALETAVSSPADGQWRGALQLQVCPLLREQQTRNPSLIRGSPSSEDPLRTTCGPGRCELFAAQRGEGT